VSLSIGVGMSVCVCVCIDERVCVRDGGGWMAFVQDRIGWMAGLTKVQALMNGLWVWLFVLYSINTPFFSRSGSTLDTAHYFLSAQE